ncbi:MFS transporter [Vogesella oryzae]|uniref:MFS transporter n=1 Tax=Vogesella oryzae TaxID=1735285 RepID=UPI0015819CFB|nr:MFS transporter [Vogesella oryzae]
MRQTFLLMGLTAVAVVSDAMLLPFYPQFFAARFGMHDPQHVGAYVAAMCLVVMFALPLWARVVRYVPLLQLLLFTQLAAGLLCLYCYWSSSLAGFWLVSLAMIACKGSSLLVYPQLMALAGEGEHTATVGLLSVIVHFGGIVGALLGGLALQGIDGGEVFLLMAAGDAIQIGICLYLLWRCPLPVAAAANLASPAAPDNAVRLARVYRLGLLMLLFYFSAYLVRAFFALHWQAVSGIGDSRLAAAVFALPALLALGGLWHNQRRARAGQAPLGSLPAMLLLGCGGLLLQALPDSSSLLLGRCLFGWALFQLTVQLDVQLFQLGTPASYAADYSKINFCQNLGVLAASYAAGLLVAGQGLATPFLVAAAGFVLSALLYPLLAAAQPQPAAA